MRATGMNDMQQIREIMRMSRSVFDSSGKAAMGRLGVMANPNAQGLTLFNSIADAYQRSNLSPLLKSKLMEDIFGARSFANLLPMLRMTQEQRRAVQDLASDYETKALPAIQQFQFASAMLSETLMVKIAFPLAQTFIPVFESVISIVNFATGAFFSLNKMLGGALVPMLAFAALGSSLAIIWIAVGRITTAFKALLPVLKANAAVQAFITALQGPQGIARVVAAGAIAGGVIGLGVYGISKMNGGSDSGPNAPGSKMNTAADKMLEAAGMFKDGFSQYWKMKGINQLDVAQIARQQALGAIG
jgi:hypothetical protein